MIEASSAWNREGASRAEDVQNKWKLKTPTSISTEIKRSALKFFWLRLLATKCKHEGHMRPALTQMDNPFARNKNKNRRLIDYMTSNLAVTTFVLIFFLYETGVHIKSLLLNLKLVL
jgi:hypothetical protein